MSLLPHRPRSAVATLGHNAATGAAIRRGHLKISDPMPFSPRDSDVPSPQESLADMNHTNHPFAVSSPQINDTWSRKTESHTHFHGLRSNGAHDPTDDRDAYNATPRISAGLSFLNSSVTSTPSKVSLSRRKNAGFTATLRRMFGSKKRRETIDAKHESQLYEDPGNLTSPKASSQYLSHQAIVPDTITNSHFQPQPLHTSFERFDMDSQPQETPEKQDDTRALQRRRNTLPSVSLSHQEAQTLAATLGDMGVRFDGQRGAHHSDHNQNTSLKRRSRSAEAWREELRSHHLSPIQWRRRSGEIEYWRNSAVESHPPDPVIRQHPTHRGPRPEQEPVSSSQESRNLSVNRDSLKQFDFGPLTNVHRTTATLEDRVTTLEVKFVDHEYAIATLQGYDMAKQAPVARTPKRRSVQELFPEGHPTPRPSTSSNRGRTFLTSPADSLSLVDDPESPARHHRTSNCTTIRPATAVHASEHITTEQFEALRSLVLKEQFARHGLEEQLMQLRAQIEELHNTCRTPYGVTTYPTPSPESRPSPTTLRRQPGMRSFGFSRPRLGSDETSRFSATDADDSGADEAFEEVFETPRESQGSRFDTHEAERRSFQDF